MQQQLDQLINTCTPKDLTWKSPALFLSLFLFSKYYPSSTKQHPYTTQDVVKVPFQNTTVSYQKFITTSEDVRIIRFKVDSEISLTDDQIFQVLSLEIHPSERSLYTLSKQWGRTIVVQREIHLSKPVSPLKRCLKVARFVLGTLGVLYSGVYAKQLIDSRRNN